MSVQMIIVPLLFSICIATLSLGCQVKQHIEGESFICVCNEEHCDSISTEPNSLDDHLTIFQTDKSSHRLAKSLIHVNDLITDSGEIADIHVLINATDRKQQIIGFGGAFTDATGININKLPDSLADKLIEDYFGPNGLQYTVCRVVIGGSDFSDRPYSYDDVENDFELKHFSLVNDDYQYKIKYIRKALNLTSDLKLFGSSWSPPTWLKTSGKFNGLGILKDEPGSIYWKTYANYLVKFLQAYEALGINFWGLTPENEPNVGLNPGWRWNALGFTGSMMRDFIKKDLGPALKAAGYDKEKLKMMIYDDNLSNLNYFINGIVNDPEAAQYVSGIAYHWYTRKYHEALSEAHYAHPEYFLLSTEACEGFRSTEAHLTLGNWTRAENIAADVIEGLNNWSNGWVDWNLVLDENGGPNWAGNWVDAFIFVNDSAPEYYKQPMFYAFGHFSKFLRPGSTRVGHSISAGMVDENVKITTFLSPSNDLIFTLLNRNQKSIKLSIAGFDEKPFLFTFEPRSITTIIKPLK
uniref:Glucosylceramidase n=2 Tax=Tetranychus urticae TaxID=32264 RepID=T1K1B4_TETUR